MKGLRVAITIVVVVLWGMFVPAAMAADHCAAMGGMCEGPCGASCTVTPPAVPAVTDRVTRAPSLPVPAIPQSDGTALELPPKSVAPSA
jgi:hypothetical protein